ncbi:MAG: hypothetical protein KGZ93_01450 [Actinobacteria bacterium]|nr:hypothetical protein [Actinomycetota bacterium]
MGIKDKFSGIEMKNALSTSKGKGIAFGLLLVVLSMVVLVIITFALPKPGNLAVRAPNAAVPQPAPPPPPSERTTETVAEEETVSTNYDLFEYKDPFKPLVEEIEVPIGLPSGTEDGTGEGVSLASLALVDVVEQDGARFAIVTFDGVEYTVGSGERVAGSSFMVEDIGEGSITVLYGDDRFTLQLGQEIVK